MFLKPVLTQEAAKRLGFHLNYRPDPNGDTYMRLLDMAWAYHGVLTSEGLSPRDLMDVQSFLWSESSSAECFFQGE